MVWGLSVTTYHIWCFCRVPATLPRLLTPPPFPLLLFLRQEGDVHFQQDNACPHMATATQLILRCVHQLPWSARTPDLLTIEHVWDMIKRERTLYSENSTTIAKLRQRVQDAWENLSTVVERVLIVF